MKLFLSKIILIISLILVTSTGGCKNNHDNNVTYAYNFEDVIKKNYVINKNPLPTSITKQISEDQKNKIKSISNFALEFKYGTDKARKTFFGIEDNQLLTTNNIPVQGGNRKVATKINYSSKQKDKVKEAIANVKLDLAEIKGFTTKNTKINGNNIKTTYGASNRYGIDIKNFSDGDTIESDDLINKPLLFNHKTKSRKKTARLLVLDTDETFGTRNNAKKSNNNEIYTPTRLGYTQKAVAKIVQKLYEGQKGLFLPINIDTYNRTLGFLFTPDGIPGHKLMCDYYGAGIYNKKNMFEKPKWLYEKFNHQGKMINYGKDRASYISDH